MNIFSLLLVTAMLSIGTGLSADEPAKSFCDCQKCQCNAELNCGCFSLDACGCQSRDKAKARTQDAEESSSNALACSGRCRRR